MLKLQVSVEYMWRVAIVESVGSEHEVAELIRFFWYSRWTVYDVIEKYNVSKNSNAYTYESFGSKLIDRQRRYDLVEIRKQASE